MPIHEEIEKALDEMLRRVQDNVVLRDHILQTELADDFGYEFVCTDADVSTCESVSADADVSTL